MDIGVADGARTHDNRNHNPAEYYLRLLIDMDRIYINQQVRNAWSLSFPILG